MQEISDAWHYMDNSDKAQFIIEYFGEEILDRLTEKQVIDMMESDKNLHEDVFMKFSGKE